MWTEQLGRISCLLADPRARVVGWGTGSVFDYFFHRQPLRLAYLVDNDPSRHGTCRAALTVFGPDRLRQEDPSRTVVVVYSAWHPDIIEQLAGMGFPHAAPASLVAALQANTDLTRRVEMLGRLAAASPSRRGPSGDRALIVQGPIVPSITPHVLRATSALHPETRIILSTWETTGRDLLDCVAPFVDDVLLSPLPRPAGIQNRNCQIVSTRAGLECARAHGARFAIKSRTDLALLAPDLFERAATAALTPAPTARSFGLSGRLVVPSTFTRKHLLYHPSDLVMAGHIDDLMDYWSTPLDPRSGALEEERRDRLSLLELCDGGNPAETYLAVHFCLRIGRRTTGTLADSWRLLRDFFVVVDDDALGLLWLKNLVTPDAGLHHGPRALVSHAFWRALAGTRDDEPLPEPELDPATITLRDFGAAALASPGAAA